MRQIRWNSPLAWGLALALALAAPALVPTPAHAQAKPAPPQAAVQEPTPAAEVPEESPGIPIPDKLDPRVIGLIEQRRAELVAEEDRINRQREELNKLRADVDTRIEELKKVQVVLEELVKTEQTQRQDRLTQLVKVLTSMRPASAAAVVGRLDDQMAVEVFSRMQSRAAGAVMGALKPEQAARISEMLTRTREAQQAARIAEQAAAQGAQPPPPAQAPAPPKR